MKISSQAANSIIILLGSITILSSCNPTVKKEVHTGAATGALQNVPSSKIEDSDSMPYKTMDSKFEKKGVYESGWIKDTGQGDAHARFMSGITDASGDLVPQLSKNQDKEGLPYGIPNPGRYGHVLSPYTKKTHWIKHPAFPNRKEGDVVVCPGTGKRFICP